MRKFTDAKVVKPDTTVSTIAQILKESIVVQSNVDLTNDNVEIKGIEIAEEKLNQHFESIKKNMIKDIAKQVFENLQKNVPLQQIFESMYDDEIEDFDEEESLDAGINEDLKANFESLEGCRSSEGFEKLCNIMLQRHPNLEPDNIAEACAKWIGIEL